VEIEAHKPATGSEVLQHQIKQQSGLACARLTDYDKMPLSTVFTEADMRVSYLTIHDAKPKIEISRLLPCS
jgi:hypothetical protein